MQIDLERIREVREFNRFYTGILGLLNGHILNSAYSLAEARILFELNTLGGCTANTLTEKLLLDKSYMSRIIRKFMDDGLVTRQRSSTDKRFYTLRLTQRGQTEAERLIRASDRQIEGILAPLSETEQREVLAAMLLVKRRLSQATIRWTIRPILSAGHDSEYMIARQLQFYEREYGLTSDIWKNYVSDGVHHLISKLPSEESCAYLLEANGVSSGCVAIAHVDEAAAQLRFFFVEPELRGCGCGSRLLEAALAFCREKRYQSVFLWTFSKLSAARHLYSKHGFELTQTHENGEWGIPVLEERWQLNL